MERATVLQLLADHRDELASMGVAKLSVFGSVARNEARPESDVDILVEIRRPMGLFQFLDIKEYLEQLLGRPVDLVTPDSLKPRLRDRILGEAVPIVTGSPATG